MPPKKFITPPWAGIRLTTEEKADLRAHAAELVSRAAGLNPELPVESPLTVPWVPAPDRGWIYAIWCEGYTKIGMALNVDTRLADLSIGNPFPLRAPFRHVVWRNNMSRAESLCHRALTDFHHQGEWFKADLSIVRCVMIEAAYRAARERQWELANIAPHMRTQRGIKHAYGPRRVTSEGTRP